MTQEKKAVKTPVDSNTPTGNIYQKIALVMKAVEGVAKKGHNSFQNYDYATEADILEAIRGALVTNQLLIMPDVIKTDISDLGVTTLDIDFTIIDASTGEQIIKHWIGTGHDKLDKGAYKAMTGAVKYFLLKTFLIPTNDDPEKDNKEYTSSVTHSTEAYSSGPTPKQTKMIYALLMQKGRDEVWLKSQISKEFGVSSTRDLSPTQASKVIDGLMRMPDPVRPEDIPDDLGA